MSHSWALAEQAEMLLKEQRMQREMRERREEGDLGGRPSLRDYELRKKYDMRRADANPVTAAWKSAEVASYFVFSSFRLFSLLLLFRA